MSLSRFMIELKRRRVFRVAAVYAAVGFVVLEAADLILPRLGVPDWALSLIVILAIAGLLIAVALAWALEITPEGVKRTAPATVAREGDDSAALPPLIDKRAAVFAMALVVLGAGLGAGWVLKPEPVAEAQSTADDVVREDDRSIAVLPFDDLSPDRDQEWFSDGLTEEILNSLARLDEIRVTARNSSFQFKNRAVDVREVGRQLGVANVVEGSVRRSGDQLRITAQLIRAADGFHLWSDTYNRHLDDVFAVQQDIAENIARVLDVYLDDERRERMVASGTRDPAAFLYYLRGRAAYAEAHRLGVGESDLLWQANAWFDRALAVDSTYALARFYHHDAYSHGLMLDLVPPADLMRAGGTPDLERIAALMHADLDRALRDAGDGPLGRSLAVVRHFNRGDWSGLRRAVTAFDQETMAHDMEIAGAGWLWFPMMILHEKATMREMVRWQLQRDPLDVDPWSSMIMLELRAGRVTEARRFLDQADETGVQHKYLEEARVAILLAEGRTGEVLAQESRLEEVGIGWWAAAMAHAELGNIPAARAAIERGRTSEHADRICWLLARIGDQPGANECASGLDASPQGWVRLSRLIVHHGSVPFDPEATPRFTAMYASTGAPPWPRTVPAAAARQR